MAKKKPTSSPRKSGNAKTTKPKRRAALDNSTSEEALEAAIERQRQAIEEGLIEEPLDPNDLVETLLDVPNRKPLDDPGNSILCTHGLVRFVHDKPSLYKKFVMQMREGATLNSAIFSSKFCNPALVRKWLSQGMQDAEDEKDTFFSRLYYDVAGANAEKRAEVEILVAEADPKFWLQHGPGKYLDDEWKPKLALRGNANAPAIEAKPEGEGVLQIESKPDKLAEDEIEGEMLDKAPVKESQYEAALKAMRDAGVHPEQQPEGWIKSFRIQSGEQLSEEELEVREDEESPISLGSNEALLTEQQRQAQSSLPC
jgi:hypothetical protein